MSEPLPRVLLVEDDPVGRAFLTEALRPLPLVLDAVGDGASAIALARARRYALAVLDLQLPDGDGAVLLPMLRTQATVRAAIALTADAGARLDQRLRDAGFAAVAHKPLAAATLRALVAEWIDANAPRNALTVVARAGSDHVAEPPPHGSAHPRATESSDAPPMWDDAVALSAAGGRREIVDALRALLLTDLPAQRSAVAGAVAGDHSDAALPVLHRMRAACGFCGATALDRAVRALQDALARGSGIDERALAFDRECARLAG